MIYCDTNLTNAIATATEFQNIMSWAGVLSNPPMAGAPTHKVNNCLTKRSKIHPTH